MKRAHLSRPYCCYCKRDLLPAEPECGLSFTYDHIRAESAGGSRRVPCCRKCNGLKGDLHPDEWFWFIRAHPRWWKLYDHPNQVRDAIRQERVYRAYNGITQLCRHVG
jgi:hypothetical protein